MGYKYVWPKIDTTWVVDEAITRVRSEIYNDYGEAPTHTIGELIYSNGHSYIVVVKYNFAMLG